MEKALKTNDIESKVINSRYILHEEIGRGGMGIVYRATDRLTGDIVAFKQVTSLEGLMPEDIASKKEADFRLNLAYEFQTLARLRHPYIISVLDYGFDEEQQPFFTMTYLADAETILEAGARLPFEGKIKLIQQLLQALAYLHRRGVMHRDIKPGNVLVSDGIVQVLDFGLSVQKETGHSMPNGTPIYMAPELLDEYEYTEAADLFSVGILFFELLVDSHPFEPFDFRFWERLLKAQPDLSRVDERLQQVFIQLLAKPPAQRFQRANEVLSVLAEALGQPLDEETAIIRESYLQTANFVGRENELDALLQTLHPSHSASCQVMLIGGESGVGKSRLIDEFRIHALVRGWQVLNGQAIAEGGAHFQLWGDIATHLTLSTEITDGEALILQQIAPKITAFIGKNDGFGNKSLTNFQHRLITTLIALLQKQTQPTLLILEDLHWARESLLPIQAILDDHTTTVAPIVIIGTYRNDEAPDIPKIIKGASEITLYRFAEAEIAELSRAILGQEFDISQILPFLFQETEGNTFFLVEAMRALAQDAGQLQHIGQQSLPDHIFTQEMGQLLQNRLDKLPHADQAILQFAAVWGRKLDLELLKEFVPSVDLSAWVQRASDVAILMIRDNQWLFSHDKLRDTILAKLSVTTKQSLHHKIAEAVETVYSNNKFYYDRLLEHWHHAGNIDRELYYLPLVAEELITLSGNFEKATRLLKRGVEAVSESDSRIAASFNWLAQISMQQSKPDDAQVYATRAYKLASNDDNLHEIGMSLMHLGGASWYNNDLDQAQHHYEKCLAIFQTLEHSQNIARSYRYLGTMHGIKGSFELAQSFHEKAISIFEELDDEGGLMMTIASMIASMADLESFPQAEQKIQRVLTLATKFGNKYFQAQALDQLAALAHAKKRYDIAKNYCLQAVKIFTEIDALRGVAFTYLHLGHITYDIGDYEDSSLFLHASLEKWKEQNSKQGVYPVLIRLALTYFKIDQIKGGFYLRDAMMLSTEVLPRQSDIDRQLVPVWAAYYLSKGRPKEAAMLLGAMDEESKKLHHIVINALELDIKQVLSDSVYEQATNAGNRLDLENQYQRILEELNDATERKEVSVKLAENDSALTINGRYILHEEIGRGGMGIVYRATDRLNGKTVALKLVTKIEELVLINGATEKKADLRLSLAHEFQTLAGLRHPHVISVLDYGFVADQQPFFAMTYLEDAETILEAGVRFSFEEKVKLIQQLLQALAYLHRRGVLHRDIKPENVLIVDGAVQVLDFGLSISKDIDSSHLVGTPLYMAPELIDKQEYSEAADLYAVGVLFYQLLTGDHPFEPINFGFWDRLLKAEPNLDKVDEYLRPLLAQLLAKQPVERFLRANDVLNRLAEVLSLPLFEKSAVIQESYLQTASFIGRQAEIDQLDTALTEAQLGKSSVWLLGGESGVGKSRLIDEFRTQALVRGWQVMRGQAIEEGGTNFQLWRDIAPHLVLNGDLTDLEAGILREIVPEIGQLLGRHIPNPPQLSGKAGQDRLIFTLVSLLQRHQQPTLYLLEDLHWAYESLEPIKQLLKVLEQTSKIMVLGTYRHDECPGLPKELPGAQTIILERLNPTQIEELANAMLGEQAVTEEIVSLLSQETEGNTFFIVEVMRALAEEVGQLDNIHKMVLPDGVLTGRMENLLLRRIAKVPEGDQHLLQLAAVAGRRLNLPLLQAFHNDLSSWLQRGSDAAIIMFRDGQWLFAHDKLRQAILNSIAHKTRQALHTKVAQVIETLYPEDEEQYQSLLDHWHHSGHIDKEIHYLVPVANRLIHKTAGYIYARELLARGLEQLPDDDYRKIPLLNLLATANNQLGEFELAHQYAVQVQKLAEQYNDTEGLAASKNNLGFTAHAQANYKEAQAFHQQALILWEATENQHGILNSLHGLMAEAFRSGRYQQTYELAQKGLALSREISDQAREVQMLTNLGLANELLEDFEQARHYYQQSLTQNKAIGHQANLVTTLINFGNLEIYVENYDQAATYLEEGLAISRALGQMVEIGINLDNLGVVAILQGNYDQANHYLQEGLDVAKQAGDRLGVASCYTILAFMHLKNDAEQDVGQAKSYLYKALTIANSIQAKPEILKILVGFASIYLRESAKAVWAGQLIGLAQSHPVTYMEVKMWIRQFETLLAEKLEPAVLESAIANGESLDLDKVVQVIMDDQPSDKNQLDLLPVSKREDYLDSLMVTADDGQDAQKAGGRQILKGESLLARLLETSKRMAQIRALDPLLSFAIDEVLSLVGAEQGYIVLVSPEGEVEYQMRRHIDPNQLPKSYQTDPISHSILNKVIQSKKGLVVRNAIFDPRFATAISVVNMQLRSIMCSPLINKDQIIGAIYVENRSKIGRFRDEDLAPLEFFSNQAAVAIENAHINDENVRINDNLENLVDKRTRELERAKDVAESANHAKTTFLSNMSHELRTPLNAILNFSAFVKEGYYGDVNDDQSAALENVIDSGNHLLNLINDILDANKIEAGMMTLFFEEIELNKFIQSVLKTTVGLIKNKELELKAVNLDNLPTIQADQLRLRQILLNVLSNAVKYTQYGEIVFRADETDTDIIFSIRDSGVGISAEDKELVFQSFVQARSNPGNVVSTGLGLPITKKMIELHGGQISFDSEFGKGTTFFVQLPKTQN